MDRYSLTEALMKSGYPEDGVDAMKTSELEELYCRHREGLSHPATFPLGPSPELPPGCPLNIPRVEERIEDALDLAVHYECLSNSWRGESGSLAKLAHQIADDWSEWAEVALKEALCLEGLLPELRAELA